MSQEVPVLCSLPNPTAATRGAGLAAVHVGQLIGGGINSNCHQLQGGVRRTDKGSNPVDFPIVSQQSSSNELRL